MTKVRTGLGAIASMALGMFALAGCSGSDDNNKGPNPPPPVPEAVANFDIATGTLPYPADPFFFAGSTDGTVNITVTLPTRPGAMRTALNSQDGWGLAVEPWTGFSMPLLPSSIPGNVKIVKVYLNPTNKAPVDVTDPAQVNAYLPTGWNLLQGPVAGVLVEDTDFTAKVDPAIDSGGRILTITPLKPFQASSGPAVTGGKIFNIGYIVYLTNGLMSTLGQSFGPDAYYAAIKAAPADCSTIPDDPGTSADDAPRLVCQFTKPQLAIASAVGIDPADVILSWSFSTQSMNDPFAVIAATATPKPTAIVPLYNADLGRIINTADLGAFGKANIYVGSTQLPYYLTATSPEQTPAEQNAAVNQSFWKALNPPPPPLANPSGQTYSYVTMFNPVPGPTTTVTVPIFVTVPRTDGASACPGMPVGGWPVAIVQHGITRNRTDAVAIADSFADACTIVVSMDLPLHGITSTDPVNPLTQLHCFLPPAAPNPACLGAYERTFDVDLDGTPGPDSSGAYMINLSSPITGRDNLRQGEADMIQLARSVPGLAVAQAAPGSLPVGAVGVNADHVGFVGLSLGSIVGGASGQYMAADITSTALSVPGGVITKLLLDSPTFGPAIRAGLQAQGLTPDSTPFGQFFRDFQTVIDTGDPFNHILATQTAVPTLLFMVKGDTVVPNNSTQRLIYAGDLSQITTLGANPVAAGEGKWSYFIEGSHGTLFDPSASLPATQEMQAQAVTFTASGGTGVIVGSQSCQVLGSNSTTSLCPPPP